MSASRIHNSTLRHIAGTIVAIPSCVHPFHIGTEADLLQLADILETCCAEVRRLADQRRRVRLARDAWAPDRNDGGHA